MKKILVGFLISVLLVTGYAWADKLSQYPLTSTLSNGDTIIVIHTAANGQINWSSMKELMSRNINWQDVNSQITSFNVNWTDLREVSKNNVGINWQAMSTQGNGINWYVMANGASSTNIACWKANGQPGKCTTSISGVNCNTCT